MEWLAWALLGLFYVGPYVLVALLCLGTVVVVAWGAFIINRALGFVTLAAIVVGAGIAGHIYLVQGPSSFNAACGSGTGIRVLKNVQAKSYVLSYARDLNAGLAKTSDATVEDAIMNVANARVEYVELQDWNDGSRPYGIPGQLAKFRDSTAGPGYFKVYVAASGSRQCRWLMPEDVESLPYRSYLSYGLEHRLNAKLLAPEDGKRCVAVDYVTSPAARYAIEFSLDQRITKNLVKHEIRVVDLGDDKALIGDSVAYQHKAEGVYSSVAFWVGNGKRHPRCPMNLLEGQPVRRILNVGTNPAKGQAQTRS